MTEAYVCDDCGFPTTDAKALIQHMRDEHDDYQFSLADVVDGGDE